jgi:hypothetical protein
MTGQRNRQGFYRLLQWVILDEGSSQCKSLYTLSKILNTAPRTLQVGIRKRAVTYFRQYIEMAASIRSVDELVERNR